MKEKNSSFRTNSINTPRGWETSLLLSVLLLLHSQIFAQEAIELQAVDAETAYAPGVQQAMEDFLDSKGWTEGENYKSNGTTFYVGTGVGNVGADTVSKLYIQSRVNAFNKAMLDAKKQLVEFLEQSIETELVSEYEEPGAMREQARIEAIMQAGKDAEAAKKSAAGKVSALKVDAENKDWLGRATVSAEEISAAESAEAVLRAGLEEEIRNLGLNPNEPVDGQVIQEIMSQEHFQKATRTVGEARIAGVFPYRSFEIIREGNKGQIGVIVLQSAKSEQIADALFTGDMSRMPVGGSKKKPLKDQISTKKAGLVSEFGVRLTRDENGQQWLLAYGQAAPKTASERSMQAAMSKAKLEAQSYLRLFLGSITATSSLSETSETVTELATGEEIRESNERFEEVVKEAAAALKISGISVKKRWSAEHPLTKHPIAGVVVGWSPSQLLAAKTMKASMEQVPTASGVSGSTNAERSAIGGDAQGNYGAMGGSMTDEEDF